MLHRTSERSDSRPGRCTLSRYLWILLITMIFYGALQLDCQLRSLYQHVDECDVCQFRSWQDG